jgi:hypothetical protein
MLSELPPVVARFVEAGDARDLDGAVACFTADAIVEDEGQTLRDGEGILIATLAGNFPGGPVELAYELTIGADDAITSFRIHP